MVDKGHREGWFVLGFAVFSVVCGIMAGVVIYLATSG